jgi:hypothetical protein
MDGQVIVVTRLKSLAVRPARASVLVAVLDHLRETGGLRQNA